MKMRCPRCATAYEIDAEALIGSGGMARCGHCGTVFDAVAERVARGDTNPASPTPLLLDNAGREPSPHPHPANDERELPFSVPDDLPPLEPSPEDALDIADALQDKRSYRGILYGLLALLLLLGLALQFAWQQREELLRDYPQLEALCAHLPCRPDSVDRPKEYQVLSRAIAPTTSQDGSLTLSATIRNDADYPQRLPDIQLSLLDNNGSVLVRRRLAPGEYLFPRPDEDRLVAAGEVFTIEIDFADPGHVASGFMIDFF